MSQVHSKLYYHFVWSTKNRQKIINSSVENILDKYVPSKIQELGFRYFSHNMVYDHIHILVSIKPSIAISDFVRRVKGFTSYCVNQILQDQVLYWQSGFGVYSVSEKDVSMIDNYVINQKRKHLNNELIEELEKFN
jgi:putative transposase